MLSRDNFAHITMVALLCGVAGPANAQSGQPPVVFAPGTGQPGAPAPSPSAAQPSEWERAAGAIARPGDANVASAFQTWKMLTASERLPFSSYAAFLIRYPDWPETDKMRRTAEGVIDLNTSSLSQVTAFFDALPPLTNGGRAKYAIALASGPDMAKASDWARRAWRGGMMNADDEARLQGLFGSAFTQADHDARMDALLWAKAVPAATRQLNLISGPRRAIFGARLAMQMRSADAASQAGAAGSDAMRDAGFVADRATWLRATGNGWQARDMLAQRPALIARPVELEKWYELLLSFAREAVAEGQYQAAYAIASKVDDAGPADANVSDLSLGVRDDYTSLTWLAGQAALKNLGRPADAALMFSRYAGGAKSPQTISKGHYWAGRAAKAARDEAAATRFFEAASHYYDHYYGQLSLERLNRPIPGVQRADLSSAAQIDTRSLYQAAGAAARFGSWQDQTRFVRAIGNNAKSDADHRAAIALSMQIGRPDLAVIAGRNARIEGLGGLVAHAYPTVSVPDGYQDNFTMIHAISRQESQFDRAAVSHAGARGLMQLMPGTARETAGRISLSYNAPALTTDTGYNIKLGSTYFDQMLRYYGGSYPLAVAAYNAGPGNVNKWLRANGDPRNGTIDIIQWVEDIPIYETRNYVQRVLENAVMYDHLNPARARIKGDTPLSTYLGKRVPG